MNLNELNITTPEHISLNYRIAGLGSRAAAHIIDWVILGLLYAALSFGILRVIDLYLAPQFDNLSGYFIAVLIIIYFIFLWGYFVLFEFFSAGRTPGKMLTGIQVIHDNGQPLTFLSSSIRNLFRIIDFLPMLYLLGILMIFFSSKHKRTGDIAAGTIVVYQRKTNRKKKNNPLEKEIEKKLQTHPLALDEHTRKKIGSKEWALLKTYLERKPSLDRYKREEMTMKVGEILFPLIGQDITHKTLQEIEDDLLALYALLKEDWHYEEF